MLSLLSPVKQNEQMLTVYFVLLPEIFSHYTLGKALRDGEDPDDRALHLEGLFR